MEGSESNVKLDCEDSIDAVSSEGEAGGVSRGDRVELGVVGRGEIPVLNLKTRVPVAGGVGGSIGCKGCGGEGCNGDNDKTVAIR